MACGGLVGGASGRSVGVIGVGGVVDAFRASVGWVFAGGWICALGADGLLVIGERAGSCQGTAASARMALSALM